MSYLVIARPSTAVILNMATLEEVSLEDEIDQEILNSSTDDIINRTRLLENDIKVSRRRSRSGTNNPRS
jgi:26S proteasome regulatory subunit T5